MLLLSGWVLLDHSPCTSVKVRATASHLFLAIIGLWRSDLFFFLVVRNASPHLAPSSLAPPSRKVPADERVWNWGAYGSLLEFALAPENAAFQPAFWDLTKSGARKFIDLAISLIRNGC